MRLAGNAHEKGDISTGKLCEKMPVDIRPFPRFAGNREPCSVFQTVNRGGNPPAEADKHRGVSSRNGDN